MVEKNKKISKNVGIHGFFSSIFDELVVLQDNREDLFGTIIFLSILALLPGSSLIGPAMLPPWIIFPLYFGIAIPKLLNGFGEIKIMKLDRSIKTMAIIKRTYVFQPFRVQLLRYDDIDGIALRRVTARTPTDIKYSKFRKFQWLYMFTKKGTFLIYSDWNGEILNIYSIISQFLKKDLLQKEQDDLIPGKEMDPCQMALTIPNGLRPHDLDHQQKRVIGLNGDLVKFRIIIAELYQEFLGNLEKTDVSDTNATKENKIIQFAIEVTRLIETFALTSNINDMPIILKRLYVFFVKALITIEKMKSRKNPNFNRFQAKMLKYLSEWLV